MISLLLAAAVAASPAGQYTAPVARYSDSWIVPYLDWPRSGVPKGTYTAASVELTVNSYGGVSGCKVVKVVGAAGMGDLTCDLLRVRARFDPARDPSGRRLWGIYRTRIIWWAPEDDMAKDWRPPADANYQVTVDALPSSAKRPAVAWIQFAVDKTGQASGCNGVSEADEDREFAQLACERLGPTFKSEAALDRGGRPVDSVQTATVELMPR